MLSTILTIGIALAVLATASIGARAADDSLMPSAHDEPGSTLLPEAVDLRPQFEEWGLPRRHQGARGTCSVFAVTGALEYALAHDQKRGLRLSVEFLNWAAHKAVNRKQDGGFFSDLWKGYETCGICSEADLPYQHQFDVNLQPDQVVIQHARANLKAGVSIHWIKEWDVHTGLSESQMEEIKSTLAKKWPVCGGFRWPKRAVWKESVLQMCPSQDVFDGHSVLIVGFRRDDSQPGGGVFLIRNSGGDGSDGMLPFAYVKAYMNDAAWIAPTQSLLTR